MNHRYGVGIVVASLALVAGCQHTPEQTSAAGENTSGVSATSSSAASAGTPAIKIATNPQQPGFLSQDIYAKLEEVPDREGTLAYIDKSVDYRSFKKILFEPTQVYLIPNPDYKGLPRDELARMTNDFQNAFVAALAPDYVIVTTPGPDVLRVRSAITGVQPVNPNLTGMDYIPIKALFNLGRKAAGAQPKVAEMSAELAILAPNGKVIGAAKATRKGDKHLAQRDQITWNDMQSIAAYWAKNFRQRLDELRGVVPANVG